MMVHNNIITSVFAFQALNHSRKIRYLRTDAQYSM